VKVLRQVFRGKLVAGLRDAFTEGHLHFPGALAALATDATFRAWLRSLYRQAWVLYAKPPFGSPSHVLHYLARYTHRVAISNHRLVTGIDDTVTFRWKDYRHGSQIRTLTLHADEFLRRFLLHVLPKRFVRIRYVGFLARAVALVSLLSVVRPSPSHQRRRTSRVWPQYQGLRGRALAAERPCASSNG
jgi:hypothetical protein